ncbi:hypothetical protein [Paenibacillus durus]|uniref:hypothetical protein n=1 Tax=Paenibacillus durus TaxID=44251 RepID=UPI000AE6B9F3|nr:hypothetical protein [Paenibacillus durus]
MMRIDRDAMLQDFLEKHVLEGWLGDLSLIEQYVEEHNEQIEADLLNAFEAVCEKALLQQRAGMKGDIQYMYISLLRTRLLENQAYYRIDAHDANWFLDPVDCAELWSADFVYRPLFNRMAGLEEMKRDYARQITSMDIEQIQQIEAVKYHLLTLQFLKTMIPALITSPKLEELAKAEPFTLSAGEYRDESIILCKLERQTAEAGAASPFTERGEKRWIIST